MKILGLGENFWLGQNFLVRAEIFGSDDNFRFGRKYCIWVKVKIFSSGEKFWVQAKSLGLDKNFRF